MTINEYFPKALCINLERRPDRWEHVKSECVKHRIEVERFPAIDMPHWGNHGCVASHAAVLEKVALGPWDKVLILEDDFEFRLSNPQKLFSDMIHQVPHDWFMLYLGGHYGDYNNSWVAKNVVKFSYMKTTSAYGVTRDSAAEMYPTITGGGPIDDLYHAWSMKRNCYIFTPRLVKQYFSYSDLSEKDVNNGDCMEHPAHENALGIFNEPAE